MKIDEATADQFEHEFAAFPDNRRMQIDARAALLFSAIKTYGLDGDSLPGVVFELDRLQVCALRLLAIQAETFLLPRHTSP